jgi:protein-serine/threonine kinase
MEGAEHDDNSYDGEPQRGRGRTTLAPQLQIPKNKSTGNLAVVAEQPGLEQANSRIRFSLDAGSGSTEHEPVPRYETLS